MREKSKLIGTFHFTDCNLFVQITEKNPISNQYGPTRSFDASLFNNFGQLTKVSNFLLTKEMSKNDKNIISVAANKFGIEGSKYCWNTARKVDLLEKYADYIDNAREKLKYDITIDYDFEKKLYYLLDCGCRIDFDELTIKNIDKGMYYSLEWVKKSMSLDSIKNLFKENKNCLNPTWEIKCDYEKEAGYEFDEQGDNIVLKDYSKMYQSKLCLKNNIDKDKAELNKIIYKIREIRKNNENKSENKNKSKKPDEIEFI